MAITLIRRGNTGLLMDHDALINRDMADQHPVESITGLKQQLDIINSAQESQYLFDNLSDVNEVTSLEGMLKYKDKYYMMPTDEADEIELVLHDMVYDSISDSFVKENMSMNLLYKNKLVDDSNDAFETDKIKALDINKDISNPDKNYYKSKVGKGWSYTGNSIPYLYDYSNNKVITLTFDTPIYIEKAQISITNCKGKLCAKMMDDTTIELLIEEDSLSTNVLELIVHGYAKEIYYESSELRVLTEDLAESVYNLFKVFTRNSFRGVVNTSVPIGVTVPEASVVIDRGNDIDNLCKVIMSYYNMTSNRTITSFEFKTDSVFPNPIDSILMGYRNQIGDTVYNLLIQNEEVKTIVENLKDYQEDIDSMSINIQQNTDDIFDVKQEVDQAHSATDSQGNIFPDLKSRLDSIQATADKSLRDKTEMQSTFELPRVKFDVASSQTVFELPFTYPMNKNHLKVYVDGLKAEPGIEDDYIEATPTSITFNYEIEAGREIVCELNTSMGLTDKIVDSFYEYNPDGTVSKITKTGDISEVIDYTYGENTKTETVTTPYGNHSTVYNYNEDGTVSSVIGERINYLGEREYMIPKVIKIRETITLQSYQTEMFDLPIGSSNSIEIKSIAILSESGQFCAKIFDKRIDGFCVYQTEQCDKSHEIIPIVYYDEDGTYKLHLEIDNLLGRSYDLSVRIDATELRTQ